MGTKAPRFDTENELNEGDTTPTPEVDNMTITAELTTLNPLVDDTESTTVAIISIEETDEDVTIVTTAKPNVTADDDEDTENTNEQETTTSENIIEDATEPQLEVETTMDEETSNDAITTTVQSEEEKEENPDQEFLCKESFKSDENSDIPLECTLTNGEDERTVLIVIPGDSLGGDRNKLLNKNVKIVVKAFMVMERGPRTLS